MIKLNVTTKTILFICVLLFFIIIYLVPSRTFETIPDGYDYHAYKKALTLSQAAAAEFIQKHNLAEYEKSNALIREIIKAVKDEVSYEYDTIHTIKTAQQTLYDEEGDCEDHAILVASILKELGIKTTIIRRREIAPGEPGHVFAAYSIKQYTKDKALKMCGVTWLALDTTFDQSYLEGELGVREKFSPERYACFSENGCCLPL